MKKLIKTFKKIPGLRKLIEEIEFRAKLRKLRKRDPFIYD